MERVGSPKGLAEGSKKLSGANKVLLESRKTVQRSCRPTSRASVWRLWSHQLGEERGLGASCLCLIKGWFMSPWGVFISTLLFHP